MFVLWETGIIFFIIVPLFKTDSIVSDITPCLQMTGLLLLCIFTPPPPTPMHVVVNVGMMSVKENELMLVIAKLRGLIVIVMAKGD